MTIPTPNPPLAPRAPWLAPALVYAFGTAVTMWIVGFVTHLPGLRPSTQAIGVGLIALQLLGMVLLGRATIAPLRAGAAGGLLTAAINFLVLGALVAPANPDDRPDRSALLIILTYLGASTVAGAAGALAGSSLLPRSDRLRARTTRDWLGRFAVVAVASAIPVLLSGAMVTSAQAGLAVRDWPSTYGALMWLYPLAKMTGGIYYEHAHRLFGSLVGLTTLVMLVFSLIAEPRKWTKLLVLGIFLLVCAQGVLGGIRVTSATPLEGVTSSTPAPDEPVALNYAQTTDTATSRALAMIHGIAAQLTVTALCIGAAVTGRRWRAPSPPTRPHDGLLRTCMALLLVALGIQLTLGAATRHFEHVHAMWTHMAFAAIVSIVACFAGMRTTRYTREHKPLKLLGLHIFIFLGIQLLLGFITMMAVLPSYHEGFVGPESAGALIVATAHQATGAALLAISTVLALWTFRLTAPGPAPKRSRDALRTPATA